MKKNLIGRLKLLSLGLLLAYCASLRALGPTPPEAAFKSVSPSPDEIVIKRLWEQTEKTITDMGRPKRLYSAVPAKTALVVVDMQEGFCSSTGCIEIPESRKIVPNINLLAAACRKKGIPVYWIRLNNSSTAKSDGLWPLFQPRSPVSPSRANPPEVFRDSGPATEVYRELHVDQRVDTQISKNRYSALISGSSVLEKLLQNGGRDTVIITGVGSDVCCESTARDAMMLDLKVIFVADATATVNSLFHEVTLMHMKMFFSDVVSTSELLHELE
jgi:ureidoacrylate peracid hydrolase